MKILHFSDIHICESLHKAPPHEFLGKRAIGLANIVAGRGNAFRQAEPKVRKLAEYATELEIDAAICTGDYTALGTSPELEAARRAVEPFTRFPLGYVTIPGNHDIYQSDALRDARFSTFFGDVLTNDLPELQSPTGWPQVRFLGEDIAVVTVNSARPSQFPWDSNGKIDERELEGLAKAIDHPKVKSRFVIAATHYAPRLANGKPDSARHGLDNADDFLKVLSPLKRGMVLHGHVHRPYRVLVPELHVPIFCAGSATHRGRENAWLYEFQNGSGTAQQIHWENDRYRLSDKEALSL